MAWKIRNQVSGKILFPDFTNEGEAWSWLGIDENPDLKTDDFHIFDAEAVENLRSEGEKLQAETEQLVKEPYLKDEDMTFGETVASYAMPITTEIARRGGSDASIYSTALGESALVAGAGPAISGANALGTKLGIAGLSKVAGPATATALRNIPKLLGGAGKLVTEMGLGGAYGAGLAKAQGRDIEGKDVAIGAGASLLPILGMKALQKAPSVVRSVTGDIAGGKDGMSGLTGVGTEALDAWGGGFGPRAKAMKDISGKSIQTRDDLFRVIDSPVPESMVVNEALSGVYVDLNPLIKDMRRASNSFGVLPSEQTAKAELDKLIGAMEQYGDLSQIPAQEARNLRQEFDKRTIFLDGNQKATNNKLNPVLKNLRFKLKESLENVAGTQEVQAENRAIDAINQALTRDYSARLGEREAEKQAQRGARREAITLAKQERKQAISDAEIQAQRELDRQMNMAQDPMTKNIYIPDQMVSGESSSRLANLREMKKIGPVDLSHIENQVLKEMQDDILSKMPKTELPAVSLPDLPKAPVLKKPVILEKKGYQGDPEYAQAMKDWSRKLGAKERIDDILGKTSKQRGKRWGSFVNTFTNSNKEYQRQVLKDIDDVYGGEFSQKLRDLVNIEKMGLQNGKAPWLSRRGTGEGKLLQVGALAMGATGAGIPIAVSSSPKLSSGLMGLSQMAEKAVNNPRFNYGVSELSKRGSTPFAGNVSRFATPKNRYRYTEDEQ